MNALEIHGLTKRRGDFTLQGLELTLPAGCIMGLIGENGAGKSTTMRLILNSLRRDSLLLCQEKDRLAEEYGILRGNIDGIDPAAVYGRHTTPYGTAYLVRRSAVPAGLALGQVNIEDLFVFMAREA